VSYKKLSTIIWYKVGYNKCKSSEEKYYVLISKEVSTILLSISLVHLRISATYFE
jgi:hypothetical protein